MRLLRIVALALMLPVVAHAAGPSGKTRPNIILIYTDDHGYADLGVQGSVTDIRTPNIDALARDGVRFMRGYVSAPQCVPSRAGVITGRYQQRFGVEDNGCGPLPLEELTIAERLKSAGYVSCQVGKWHLEPPPRRVAANKKGPALEEPGAGRKFLPLAQGFDEYFTGQMNTFIASHDLRGNKLPNAPQQLTDKRFRCVWQTDAAISFIDRHQRDPFFLYLAYFTPHVPLESPEPWFSKTPSDLPLERRQALAMIAAMDDGVGRIREKLRAAGIEKNTLIFFISDNGAPLKKGAWNGSLNLPLVGEKGMLTDGGIRTPFVAAWPGTLPAGKVYEQPVFSLDVAATAVALASLPHDEKLDGVNLVPFLVGEKKGNPHDTLYWRWRSQAAVLEFPWKLILLGSNERYLFDVTKPDGETKNLLAEHPDIAAGLEKKLLAWDKTLPPPGLPRNIVDQDQMFYDDHVNKTGETAKRASKAPREAASGPAQGWVARNSSAAVRDGALRVTPEAAEKQRPFIAFANLDIAGPVTATLTLQSGKGGAAGLAWRIEGQKDFPADQVVSVPVAASDDWQEVKAEIPGAARIIHLRLMLPGGETAIRRLELRGAGAKIVEWRFDQKSSQ